MAILKQIGTGFSINSADTYQLGRGGDGVVNSIAIHLESASFVGSITIKGKGRWATMTYVALPYKKRYLNGAVADESIASTAITGTSIILVDASGLDLALDCTSFTSGAMNVSVDALYG